MSKLMLEISKTNAKICKTPGESSITDAKAKFIKTIAKRYKMS